MAGAEVGLAADTARDTIGAVDDRLGECEAGERCGEVEGGEGALCGCCCTLVNTAGLDERNVVAAAVAAAVAVAVGGATTGRVDEGGLAEGVVAAELDVDAWGEWDGGW